MELVEGASIRHVTLYGGWRLFTRLVVIESLRDAWGMAQLPSGRMSAIGTGLPSGNVRIHGEYWMVTRPSAGVFNSPRDPVPPGPRSFFCSAAADYGVLPGCAKRKS